MNISRRQFAAGFTAAAGAYAQSAAARYPMPNESTQHGEAIQRARTIASELVQANKLPGFSIAVACGGNVVWSQGFGMANLEHDAVVTPLTRFRLGSVSKLLTAAGLARLVEEGKLNLDLPVQQYVPSFPVKLWPITTRQLAGHLAGIRHYKDADDQVLQSNPHFETVTKGLAIFANDPLLFEPGTSYAYSSYGWNLISAAMEGASKSEFLQFLQSTVFEPLGLLSMAADHVDRIIPHRTAAYRRNKDGSLVHAPYTDNSYKWASGGFVATAEDLVKFACAHFVPGFHRQATLNLLFTPQKLTSGKSTGVGLGWRVGVDAKGNRIVHHGGALDGARAMLLGFPNHGVALAMLSNVYASFGEAEAIRIGQLFLR